MSTKIEIKSPIEIHKLCQYIINKYTIIKYVNTMTIRTDIDNAINLKEYSIRGHSNRLQYSIEQTRYHLSRFNDTANNFGIFIDNVDILFGNNTLFFEMDATLSGIVHINDRLVRLIGAIVMI